MNNEPNTITFWAIGDLHLSLGLNESKQKPMECFGEQWREHTVKIARSWCEHVQREDVVLLLGDLFWGNRVEEAQFALNWLGCLPGRKVMIRGNHDNWWQSIGKVRAALPRFLGEIEQIPPMYSAIKVNGQKLYDLARQGREVARKPRRITIFDLTLTQNLGNGQYALRVVCSKGTYIRTLCHDLGQALGCGGCMAALRRTEASNFRIDEAVTLEDVQREGEALLRPTDSLFRQYPAYTIPSTEQERKCLCGNPLRAKLPDGLYRVYGRDGAFLALSEAKDGTLTSKRNFFSV